MLRDLHIRNLAVLAEASIDFGDGFNVLSGETGAGKSIVVDSLALLSGMRATNELIRTGAETLTVSGVFALPTTVGQQLDELGIEAAEAQLVIRREISRSGRNRVFVNDQPVTLHLLTELAPSLLRIHGQREELGLVAPELQRTWLDRCGGEEAPPLQQRTAAAHARYREVAARLARLTDDDQARRARLDFLRFQLTEIDDAEIEADEEKGLREERVVLQHTEAIRGALTGAAALLFDEEGAAYEALAQARQLLREVAAWEPSAATWETEIEELTFRVEDLATALRSRLAEVDADPDRLNAIEDRLAVLERLLRKYGGSSEAVLAHRETIAAELEELEGAESNHETLTAARTQAVDVYREAAGALAAGRRRWAEQLAGRVEKELRELALPKARFSVELTLRRRADSPLQLEGEKVEIAEHGYDQVTFLFSPNPGEELRPLAKVASGGELSRLYLAVQLAVQERDKTSTAATTLVFDEVDSGIGGAEAAVLGAKLKRLARGGQVLAVTHLPQVASYADHHFKVSKQVRRGRTHTVVEALDANRQVEEVARMLAGSRVTELSLSHARELIAGAGA